MEGGQKSFELLEGGTKKFSVSKGGSKKFGQIESIMKIKLHNLLLKLTEYSLRLDVYFKIFPGPSAGPALHLSLTSTRTASGTLSICVQNHIESGCRIHPLTCLTRGMMACVSSLPSNEVHP